MEKKHGKMALKLLIKTLLLNITTVEGQIPPSWLHPNMGLLPGVIFALFIQFTENRGPEKTNDFRPVSRLYHIIYRFRQSVGRSSSLLTLSCSSPLSQSVDA